MYIYFYNGYYCSLIKLTFNKKRQSCTYCRALLSTATFRHTPRLSSKGTVSSGHSSWIRVFRPESYRTDPYRSVETSHKRYNCIMLWNTYPVDFITGRPGLERVHLKKSCDETKTREHKGKYIWLPKYISVNYQVKGEVLWFLSKYIPLTHGIKWVCLNQEQIFVNGV